MTTRPDPIDTFARTLLDVIATSVGEEPITDDEWNAPDITDPRAAICDAIRATLAGPLTEIAAERTRQDEKWGGQNHPDGTGGGNSAAAAVGARLACQLAAKEGTLSWRDVLREEVGEAFAEVDPSKLRAELVQVAAVAVAWVEAIDRRTTTPAADG